MSVNTNPLIMGIVNTTPDSFSDGGRFVSGETALNHALQLIDDGADIIDIGGESTRPGAKEVDIETEIARTIPLIKSLREKSDILISIDTRKPQIAKLAKEVGANIWNDVSALTFSSDSMKIAADLDINVVIMHYQGIPETMQDSPFYRDVIGDVMAFLSQKMGQAIHAGIKRNRIILDVGICFGKTLEHNIELIAKLDEFNALGCPLLFGASRKSMIGKIDESASDPMDRIGGSLALALMAADRGADILRVHDVRQTKQALKIRRAILEK